MAKVATKKTVEAKKKVVSDDAEMLALLEANEVLNNAEASDGANVSFISLAKEGCKALDEDDPEFFIKDLKVKEYYIGKMKTRLGQNLKVVPLAFLNLFNQFSEAGNDGVFQGIWQYKEGDSFPLLMGSYYDRELPNDSGILKPVIWIPVYLPDFPDIVNPVITFKVTGTKVAKAWKKEIQGMGYLTTQCLYSLGVQKVKGTGSFSSKSWLEVLPTFVETIFEKTAKGVEITQDYAKTVIEASNTVRQSYFDGTLVPSRIGTVGSLAIEDNSSDDEDDVDF